MYLYLFCANARLQANHNNVAKLHFSDFQFANYFIVTFVF